MNLDEYISPEKEAVLPNPLSSKEFPEATHSNASIAVHPSRVAFHKYKLGEPVTQLLHIINRAGREQRFHILPLEEGPFSLHYEKKQKLLPGMKLAVQVNFFPQTYSQCSQTLHIHCPNEENLSIPITAIPIPNLSGFPSKLHFPNTPIRTSHMLQFSLNSDLFTPFTFEMRFNPPSECFSVFPPSGSVAPEGSIEILVTFTPNLLQTTISNLELALPEIDSKTRVCSCTGSCLPNDPKYLNKPKTKTKLSTKLLQQGGVILSKRKLSSGKKRTPLFSDKLPQQKEKLDVLPSRERAFLQEVRQCKEEEKMNQLKWSTNLGASGASLTSLKDQRSEPRQSSQSFCHDMTQIELIKTERCLGEHRSDPRQLATTTGEDLKLNWKEKRDMLYRFSLAAKRVVIRLRAENRLKCLRLFLKTSKLSCLSTDEYAIGLAQPPTCESEPKLPSLQHPIPFHFIHEECAANSSTVSPFIPIEISKPVIKYDEKEKFFQTTASNYQEQQGYMKMPLFAGGHCLAQAAGKEKRKGAEHEFMGVETQKLDKTEESELGEELVRALSQPIPPHILDGPPVPRSSILDPYPTLAYMPMCPVTETDPEYHLLPFKPTPFAHLREEKTPEEKDFLNKFKESLNYKKHTVSILEEVQPYLASKYVPLYRDNLLTEFFPLNPAPEMKPQLLEFEPEVPEKLIFKENTPTFETILSEYNLPTADPKSVHFDREEMFKKIAKEEREKSKGLDSKVEARLKVMKNLMSPEFIEKIPDWMW